MRRRIMFASAFAAIVVSASVQASSSASASSYPYATDVLVRTNELRRAHGSPPVLWDANLANLSAQWAASIRELKTLQHSRFPYGENIARIQGKAGKNATAALVKSIDVWYAEGAGYNYSASRFSDATGHFTQLVWASTRRVGAASIDGFVVMEFDPPGNKAGAFARNVMPPLLVKVDS